MQMTASKIMRRLGLCLCAACAVDALASCSEQAVAGDQLRQHDDVRERPTTWPADGGVRGRWWRRKVSLRVHATRATRVRAESCSPPPARCWRSPGTHSLPPTPAIQRSSTAGTCTSRVSSSRSTTSRCPTVRTSAQVMSPAPSSTVAKVSGPWAVGISAAQRSRATRRGRAAQAHKAVPIAALAHQNYPPGNGAPFDTSGTSPYAFGFDMVPATSSAMNVNLGRRRPERLRTDGGRRVLDPLRRHRQVPENMSCTCPTAQQHRTRPAIPASTARASGRRSATYGVPFHLCFKSPTTLVNCQNPDNDPAQPLAGEEHERGIFFKSTSSVIGQVTVHTDHPFWRPACFTIRRH